MNREDSLPQTHELDSFLLRPQKNHNCLGGQLRLVNLELAGGAWYVRNTNRKIVNSLAFSGQTL